MKKYLLFLLPVFGLSSCNYDPAGELLRETGILAAVTAIYLGNDANTLPDFILVDKDTSESSIKLVANQPTSATDDIISFQPAANLAYTSLKAGTYSYHFSITHDRATDGDDDAPEENGKGPTGETTESGDNDNTDDTDQTEETKLPKEETIEKGTIYSILIGKNNDQSVRFIVDNLVKKEGEIGIRWIADDNIVNNYKRTVASYKIIESETDEVDTTVDEEEGEANEQEGNNEEEENYEIFESTAVDKEPSFFPFKLKDEDRAIKMIKLLIAVDDPDVEPISFSIEATEFDNVKNVTIYTSQDENGKFEHRYFIHPSSTQ